MRTTRIVPARPRPVLIATALAVTTAGSLLLAPHTADADPRPVTREDPALDRRAAQAPASAAERALAAPAPATTAPERGYPREQVPSRCGR